MEGGIIMGMIELDDDWYEPIVYTYEELLKEVDEEWKSMSEDEKHMRNIQCDPTFKQFVGSHIKPGQSVEINEHEYSYKIL